MIVLTSILMVSLRARGWYDRNRDSHLSQGTQIRGTPHDASLLIAPMSKSRSRRNKAQNLDPEYSRMLSAPASLVNPLLPHTRKFTDLTGYSTGHTMTQSTLLRKRSIG